MAFCSNCGAQLEGTERFCVRCGVEQTTKTGGAAAATPSAATPPVAMPPQPVLPFAGVPPQHPPAPLPIPIMMPPPAPAKGSSLKWIVMVIVVVAGGFYYNHSRHHQHQALAQAQQFIGNWDNVNGIVQISQGQWRNGSDVAIQSVTLECKQFAQNGQTISSLDTKLNGPAQPGQTVIFSPFQVGQMAQGVSKLQCNVVDVNPAQ